MPETIKVLQTVKTPDRLESLHYMARTLIMNKIGLKVDELKDADFKKLNELAEKSKKPIEFAISFDGDWFSYFTRVGTVRSNINQTKLSAETDLAKRTKVLEALVSYGAATQAQADAFNKANADPKVLADLKQKVEDAKKKVAADQKELDDLTKKYKALGGT